MTSQQQNLSAEQKEPAAVGVGAGSQPCVSQQGCSCGTHNDEPPAAPVTAEQPDPLTTAKGDESASACGADAETDEAPGTAEEPAATTGGHAAGCSGMAARFASGDVSQTMAGCREMFERFMSAGSAAETDEAPATTTATGRCKKEA